MHRETAHPSRRSRSLVVLMLALAIVAVFGIAAQQALAVPDYAHDGATACSSCHDGVPSAATATNAKCITCHATFAVPTADKTCWTCHNPGQNMNDVAGGAPTTCTTVCHKLPGGATVPNSGHNPHPDRGVCTTCHTMSTGIAAPNGSPHHTAKAVTPVITIKAASSVKVKKPITIAGKVTPTTLAGKSVLVTIQMKSGIVWKTVKAASAKISATGAYSYKYTSKKKGTFQVQASTGASAGFLAAVSPWKSFKVK
jgi:hypothetical protein